LAIFEKIELKNGPKIGVFDQKTGLK